VAAQRLLAHPELERGRLPPAPKAGYWTLKRAFAPLLVSWRDERPNVVGLWVTNDRLEAWQGTIEVELVDFFGNRGYHTRLEASMASLSSGRVAEFSKNLVNVTYANFEYLVARPTGAEAVVHLFEMPKHLNLGPAALGVRWGTAEDGTRRVAVTTDRFTRMVRLEGDLDGLVLDDNYFDLEPGQTKIVTLRGDHSRIRGLRVAALNAPAVTEPTS